MRDKTLRKHVYSQVSVELRQEKAGDIRLISGLFLLNTLWFFFFFCTTQCYTWYSSFKKLRAIKI